ncbi:MAG: tetratricopeptide repeat protein [Rhodocyclaceae bacterium]
MPNFARLTVSFLTAVCPVVMTGAAWAADAPRPAMSVPAVAPATELTGQYVYELMLAEIAAARGDYALAGEAYVDLARRTRDGRIARRATEVSLMGQQVQRAGEAARLWVEAEPDSVPALQTLAVVLAGGYGSQDDLEPPLARLLASGAAPIESMLMQLPRMYGRYVDKAASAAAVERLTTPYLNVPEAHLARALAFNAAQNPARVRDEINAALAQRPDWEAAALVRAQAAPRENQAEAMAELNAFATTYPQAREARVLYVRWLVSEKRFDEAKAAYRKLESDFAKDDDVAYLVVALAVQSDDFDTAERQLQRLIDNKYRDVDLLRLQLGQLYEEAQEPKRAIAQYKQVGRGQHYGPAQARMAVVMARGGDIDGARALLQKAANDHPDEAATYMLAESQMLRELNKPELALDAIGKLLVKEPQNVDALYEASMLQERLKRYDDMEATLRRLIVLKPDFAHAYNALGYSLADRNVRLDDADKLLTQAIRLAPDDGAIMDSMGWLRYRQGNLPAALDFLQRAYTRLQDSEVAAHLGEVLWVMGRRDDARRTWDESRKINPDSPALAETMKRLTQ